jgi:hypothetical protein
VNALVRAVIEPWIGLAVTSVSPAVADSIESATEDTGEAVTTVAETVEMPVANTVDSSMKAAPMTESASTAAREDTFEATEPLEDEA